MKKIVLALALLCLLNACSFSQDVRPLIGGGTPTPVKKITMAMYAIERLYVDSVNSNKLAEDAIIGMLAKLDPHSSYSTPEEERELNEPLEGNFEGIGVSFNVLTDTLYIVQVIPGGPSEKVGILPGDRIIYVDDTLIAGVKRKQSDIVKMLRGKKGTTVEVKIMRGRKAELLTFRIVRDKIPIFSLDASYMMDKETGYIKLNRFAATTHEEFNDALRKLKEKGMKNLILDLQGNGGGYLRASSQISNDFLKAGSLIVYTEGLNKRREDELANSSGSFEEGRLVILVDESSASASEIVSGAIQDWDRGVIVGRRTFGKGLVQHPIPFPDGSLIRLTTARYHTPTGRSIQKPYEKGNSESYNREMIDRYNRGEMISADSIHFPDSLKYYTLRNKRVVYGGGGIMPDYFVPMDTTRVTDIYREMNSTSLIYRYILNYVDENRAALLGKYETFDLFNKNFKVTESMLSDLLEMYRKELEEGGSPLPKLEQSALPEEDEVTSDTKSGKSPKKLMQKDREDWEKSKPLVSTLIKARIASDLYDSSAFYEVINEYTNDALKKALEIINDPERYDKLLDNRPGNK